MKTFARIENGKVVETLQADELPEFHPSLVWVECPNQTSVGWDYDGNVVKPPTVDVVAITSRQWNAIKAERDRRKTGGVKVGVGGVDKWFHSDDASRIQQMALVMMGANIPANLQWKTLDGSFVTMTQAVAQSVFVAAAASDQAIFAVAEGHRAALAACEDPAVYDYSTGWPAVFGE